MGYTLIPLMLLVGTIFQLDWTYYLILTALSAFVTLRMVQKRNILLKKNGGNTTQLIELGEVLSKDFVIIAIIFTLSLMLSNLLRIAIF